MFLLGTYFKKPKEPKRTKEKGYMLDSNNFSYEETINICTSLKLKDSSQCQVVLDLKNKKVNKNSFNNNFNFEELLYYYQNGYPDYLNPILANLYKEELDAIGNVSKEEKEDNRP